MALREQQALLAILAKIAQAPLQSGAYHRGRAAPSVRSPRSCSQPRGSHRVWRRFFGRAQTRDTTASRAYRDRDGLLVFFVRIILFCVAAAVYPFTNLLVAAAPVVMLASCITISCMTPYTSRRVVGQWGGAGGASCEDHFGLAGRLRASRGGVWSGRAKP